MKITFSVIVGVLVVMAGVLFFKLALWLALIIGAVCFLGLALLLTGGRKKPPTPSEAAAITQDEAIQVIRDGRKKLSQMRRLVRNIRDGAIAQKVRDICAVVDLIFDDFRKDPKDIRAAQRFLNYYLDATVMIIQQYVDLSRRVNRDEAAERAMQNFRDLLDTIQDTFEKQHDKLLRDDVLDLDTEITVLKRMMEMDGPR